MTVQNDTFALCFWKHHTELNLTFIFTFGTDSQSQPSAEAVYVRPNVQPQENLLVALTNQKRVVDLTLPKIVWHRKNFFTALHHTTALIDWRVSERMKAKVDLRSTDVTDLTNTMYLIDDKQK